MASPMDRQLLVEELTVLEVILKSLDGEAFEGVEDERRAAAEEMGRIKRTLKAMAQATTTTSAEPETAAAALRRHSEAPQPSPAKRRVAAQSPAGPSPSPRNSAAMATPRQPIEPEGWVSPASLALRSRKRDFGSTNLQPGDGLSKSRRTTPTSGGNNFNGSSRSSPAPWDDDGDDVEIIDLTGADVEADSTFIAEQLKQEQRHMQEMHDRQIAMLLSSQDPRGSTHDISGPAAGSNPAHPTAFSKLMTAQQSNARRQPPQGYKPDGDLGAFLPNNLPEWPSTPASWPYTASNLPTLKVVPSQRDQVFRDSSTLQPQGYNSFGPASNNNFGVGQMSLAPDASTATHFFPNPSSLLNSQQPFAPLFPGPLPRPVLPGAPTLPSQGNSTLVNIINKTNLFDYTMNLDENGHPLPTRLVDYLHDSYHDPRFTDKELDNLLLNIRPDMDIPEKNRDGTPEGLKSPLYPHQTVALTWMKKMEDGTNKGGILADDMGLGKTISTLALMLSRQATSRPKTNLIIGPLALVRQWEEEILKKTKVTHRLSVFIYHNKKATADDLLKYDVVLTTYGTVAQELKRLDKFIFDNADRNIDFKDRALGTKFPLLHPEKSTFYRVILDEAQCIKNKDTKTAKACHKLKATYRWCLTGTPMMNGVLELFSLVHFLQIKPYCVWENFRPGFGVLFGKNGDSKSVAMNRLRALLKAIMLRRKKDSELDGKPILRLPEKSEEVVYAELTKDERDFYNQLEKQSQVQFSKYLRDGSIGKNYSSILVLLLRLRQACCHPHLNLDVDDAAPASSETMMQLVKTLDRSIVARIKEIDAFECPICYDAVQCPSFFIPCGHDSCQQCLTRLVDTAAAINLQDGSESDKAKCPVCRGLFDPKKCFTYEAFQQVHMPECIEKPAFDEYEDSSDEDASESDNQFDDDDVDQKGNLKDFIVDDSDGGSEKKRQQKSKSKGKKKQAEVRPSMLKTLRQDAAKNRSAFKKYMRYLRKTWLPAAKVSECMRLLKDIYATGEKAIVFSQWTLLLDLLEVAMWHDKYEGDMRRYDGGMSAEQRFSAAQDFREKEGVKVLLVSLRAGNAGLNLTAASRVIIMDPFWNPYIEMQAVDRAYRIGQQKQVKVYRILTRETVEDRIVDLQNRKKEIVEAALDEAESVRIGRLNVNELRFLFNTSN